MTIYKNKNKNHKNNVLIKNRKILKIDKLNNLNFNYIDYSFVFFKKAF